MAEVADCGILFDIHNVYTNAQLEWIDEHGTLAPLERATLHLTPTAKFKDQFKESKIRGEGIKQL